MDLTYLLMLQNFREASQNVLTTFFEKITLLGNEYLPYMLLFWLYWCVDKNFGVRAMVGTAFGRLFNGVTKLTCCVYRPWIRSDAIQPYGDSKSSASGYSFPSGHTTNAVLTFGHVGWYYRRQKLLSITMYVIVALVMLSRNYLGVHTPQDVVVGLLLTMLAIFVGHKVQNWIEGGENRLILFVIGFCILSAAALAWFVFKSYPMDYGADGKLIVDPLSMMIDGFGDVGMALGAVFGLLLEKKCVGFDTEVSFEEKVTRLAVGCLLFALCKASGDTLFTLLLGSKQWGKLAGKFLMMFYGVGIHPALFTWWEKAAAAKQKKAA